MYRNVYLTPEEFDDAVDLSVPLKVTNSGSFKVFDGPTIKTERKFGRTDFQIIYIHLGQGRFYFDGTERIVKQGNIIIFRPHDIQYYLYYPSDHVEVYWAHFTGFNAEKTLYDCGFSENENVIFCGYLADHPWFFDRMTEELKLHQRNYEEVCNTLLKYILIIGHREAEKHRVGVYDRLSDIEVAKRYFTENYNKEISISEYAEKNLMSADWFIKSFKRIVSQTPNQFIISKRIDSARHLIETTDKTIKEISFAVGYSNSLYFSRLFKKYTGYSPKEYKLRMHENQNV